MPRPYTVNWENSVLKIFHVFFRVGKFLSCIALTKFLHCRCNYHVFNFHFFCVWRKFPVWRIFLDLQYSVYIICRVSSGYRTCTCTHLAQGQIIDSNINLAPPPQTSSRLYQGSLHLVQSKKRQSIKECFTGNGNCPTMSHYTSFKHIIVWVVTVHVYSTGV